MTLSSSLYINIQMGELEARYLLEDIKEMLKDDCIDTYYGEIIKLGYNILMLLNLKNEKRYESIIQAYKVIEREEDETSN